MFGKLFGFRKKEHTDIPHAQGAAVREAFAFLETDMHSHLLPGIDDGAPTIEDSITLIKGMMDLGYKKLVTTPHVKSDIYPNTTAIIQTQLKQLRQAMKEHGLDIPIHAAAEYYVDDIFMELLEKEPLLPIQGKQILIEFSFLFEPVRLPETIFRIETKGYTPILAHPERYAFYHHKYHVFAELKNRGCLLQLNTLSLTGYYGKPVKEMAEKLLNDGMYDYCGTDLHHDRHLANLQKLIATKAYQQLRQYPFINKKILL